MKGIRCDQPSFIDKLSYGELPQPVLENDEVLIEVAYAGVNFPDILISEGRYQFKPELPFSPGGEVSGTIKAVGSEVAHLKVGDIVCAAMGWGGFAEYAVSKASNTFLLPREVRLDEAAVLLETYATAFYALKDRALLKPNEKILVLGASGGTGLACIQLARLFGAHVIAICSTDEKCDFALNQGAHEAYNFNKSDVKSLLKERGGVDVIFDPVGGSLSESLFRTLNPNGRHLVVGFASGEVPKLPWNLPLLKSASVVGVFWGYFWRNNPEENARNVAFLIKWLAERKIVPAISEVLPLTKAKEALSLLKNRKVKGKVVLKVKNAD